MFMHMPYNEYYIMTNNVPSSVRLFLWWWNCSSLASKKKNKTNIFLYETVKLSKLNNLNFTEKSNNN